MTDDTDREKKTGRFVAGNPGGGRPKGSRVKLSEALLSDLQAAWKEKGRAALDKMIEKQPGDFVKVCANLIPKDFKVTVEHTANVEDIAIARDFVTAWRARAAALMDEPLLIEHHEEEPE